MKRKLLASAVSAWATLVAMPAQAATADCWSADEVAAVRTHHFAMLMMVDALKCRTTIPATQEAYDRFADQKRVLLQKNRNIVDAHFVRSLGATEGLRVADTYDTGNQQSHIGPGDHARAMRSRGRSRAGCRARP